MTTASAAIATLVRQQLTDDDVALLREIVEAHGYKLDGPSAPWIEKFEELGLVFRMHEMSGWLYSTRLCDEVVK